jgi:hypothetical protein
LDKRKLPAVPRSRAPVKSKSAKHGKSARPKPLTKGLSDSQLMAALRRTRPEKYGAEKGTTPPATATQAGLTVSDSVNASASARKRTEREDLALQELLDAARCTAEPLADPSTRRNEVNRMFREAVGVKNTDLADHLLVQIATSMNWGQYSTDAEKFFGAIALMQEIKPTNVNETLLACQMIGVHHAAMRFLQLATLPDQTFEGKGANVSRATRLMRLFNEQSDAMAKLRGKTFQQKVRVEHVHVHEGAQAIVGSVVTPRAEVGGGVTNESEGRPHAPRSG